MMFSKTYLLGTILSLAVGLMAHVISDNWHKKGQRLGKLTYMVARFLCFVK